jgi:hypothetical protein
MIPRRAFLKALCAFIATPFALLSITTKSHIKRKLPIEPDIDARSRSVLFTIQGWEGAELKSGEKADQQIVPLYLPSSWRSSCL